MKTRTFLLRPIAALAVVLLGAGCAERTGKLSPELEARFAQEGILHRAEDITFRRTKIGDGSDRGWDEKRASIVVTKESVFLHVNGKSLVEITPRSTGTYEVRRDRDRLSLRAGGGKSALSWSFRPPAEAEAWAADIRSVIKNSRAR